METYDLLEGGHDVGLSSTETEERERNAQKTNSERNEVWISEVVVSLVVEVSICGSAHRGESGKSLTKKIEMARSLR